MFKNSLNLILVLLTLSVTNVSATLITSEDFTSGATGWSNNSTSLINGDRVLGGFNLFGAGAFAQKTFTLSGNQTSVNVNLDFWKGDSWDGESFFVYVNGNLLFSQSYVYHQGTQVAGQQHASWNELLVPISLNYNTTATSLTVRFSSSLNQNPTDEWWAVDNVVINDNVSVPEPTTLAIFALGIMGLASRRFKKQ
ncbi:PEP-CTERM sorting domain-containing protein [Colwellia sp. BRX8-7]|uniref:PEP-CTERM sorting domain-containing protein n=1 Tax=Colwellia sp. BRX8-7 TaxID=2759833 RepID=UPI0021755B0D|nr:PEP-CTERM sorting domain-containing protein [Colwellia sp. BRX8-7]